MGGVGVLLRPDPLAQSHRPQPALATDLDTHAGVYAALVTRWPPDRVHGARPGESLEALHRARPGWRQKETAAIRCRIAAVTHCKQWCGGLMYSLSEGPKARSGNILFVASQFECRPHRIPRFLLLCFVILLDALHHQETRISREFARGVTTIRPWYQTQISGPLFHLRNPVCRYPTPQGSRGQGNVRLTPQGLRDDVKSSRGDGQLGFSGM